MRKSVYDKDWLAAADRYLNDCFAAETPPHVNEFARIVGVSPRSLGRVFKAQAGVGIAAYFKNGRIRRAQELLRSTALSSNAIAHAAGFGTRITFFRSFKHATGRTPEQFRAESGDPE